MFGVNTSTGGATAISGGSVTTTGPGAYAIVVGGGGSTTITGTTVAATANGGGGLSVDGGSTLTAAGMTVTTQGGYDPASGRHAYGLYNGPSGTVTSGGAAEISNSTISTLGEGMHGVVTGAGGTTALAGTNVSTVGRERWRPCLRRRLHQHQRRLDRDRGAERLWRQRRWRGLPDRPLVSDDRDLWRRRDRAATGSAGTITATGPLDIRTKSPSAAAVALQGDGATIAATGGGTIAAAGTAIAFLGGTGQSATFDNFKIGALSGDLVFADPSIATLNFNAVTANASTGNLLDATAGSAIAFNANASMLTGAIVTDAASTTSVNLTNGTTWNLHRLLGRLQSEPRPQHHRLRSAGRERRLFKTLTVNNYVGNGANIAMNVALGGSGSAGDRIIVDGGKGDRLDASDDQECRRRRRTDVGRRHPDRHGDQRRGHRGERLFARQHPDRGRLQVLARLIGRCLVSGFLADRDGGGPDELDQQCRQGPAVPDDHQPGAGAPFFLAQRSRFRVRAAGAGSLRSARSRLEHAAFWRNQGFPNQGRIAFQSPCWVWRPAWMTAAYSLDLRERSACPQGGG